jgi:hypothetical protein
MRVKLQRVMCHDDGHEETITDVITLNTHNQRLAHLGVTWSEAKQLRSTTQHHLRRQPVDACLDPCADGPDGGTPLQRKSHSRRALRTLVGTVKFSSPRRAPCRCTRRTTASFRPLAARLTASVSPALLSLEAQGSSLAAYGMRLNALKAFLPLDRTLDVNTVRDDTLQGAKRLAAEWGDDHRRGRDGDPSDGRLFPPPDGACPGGLAGGDVRQGFDKQHHGEVMVGKRVRSVSADAAAKFPSTQRRGCVPTLETPAKRRLYEGWHAPGIQMQQESTLRSDGDDKRRQLPLAMRPKAPHIWDGLPLTLTLTVLGPCGKGLVHGEAVPGEDRGHQMARRTWSLGHGQVDKALRQIDDLETSRAPCSEASARFPRLVKALSAWRPSIVHHRYVIPHDRAQYHHGAAIATGFVESTGNEVVRRRCCKQQQRPWSKAGAHVLFQTRVRTLHGALGAIFKGWYPDMDLEVEEIAIAA